MSERDWEAELKKIDKQMERMADAPPPAAPAVATRGAAPAKPGASVGAPIGAAPTTTGFGVFARLSLAVALGIGMIFWPYSARCGLGLAAFLGAVTALIVAGVWSSIWTWRHRAARAHTLSLLLVLWGLVLAGLDVLPRTGYAVPTAAHPAGWACTE